MIKVIFIKEFSLYLKNSIIAIFMAIIFVLFIITAWISISNVKDEQQTISKLEIEKQDDFRNIGLSDIIFRKQKLIYGLNKLSFISGGNYKLLPNGVILNYFNIERHKRFSNNTKPSNLFFSLDLNNIVLYILSFMCICLSYNVINEEKVDGTMKLLLSNSIHKWQIIVGKYLAIIMIIMLPFIIGCLVTILLHKVTFSMAYNMTEIIQILLFIVGTFLFISFVVLSMFLISILSSRPVVSLSYSLVFWIFFAIVIPNTNWLLSKLIISVPSRSEVTLNEQQIKSELANCPGNFDSSWDEPNPELEQRVECFSNYDQIHTNIWNDYDNTLFQQTDFAIRLTKVSPFAIYSSLSSKIANSGYYRYKKFYDEIFIYWDIFKKFCRKKDLNDSNSYHLLWNEEFSKKFISNKLISYEEIPHFKYENRINMNELITELLSMIVINIILFLFVSMMFIRRFDPR